MSNINWGVIGCGNVCEVKSGPAFNKIKNSRLLAVMRRDISKAEDFAHRHHVKEFYNTADKIIHHKKINAVYIATPPAYHEEYAVEALKNGKMVYIEKPVTLNANSCRKIISVTEAYNAKVSVAHYRRALPLFLKIKDLLKDEIIGKIRVINIQLYQATDNELITNSAQNWRVQPDISGGGLFHDLAPHQLDIIYWLLGHPVHMFGSSINQTGMHNAPDITSFEAVFDQSIFVQGMWLFNTTSSVSRDTCEIIGDKGKMEFSFFRDPKLTVIVDGKVSEINFSYPAHIQLPMIEKVVRYFRGKGENPCSLEDALVTMKMLDCTI